MPTNAQTEARKLHGRLNHPIIDADGHPFGDRIIPAAIIPMYSPEETIEELEFASKQMLPMGRSALPSPPNRI